MLLESLKACVLKSNVVYSSDGVQETDNTSLFRARANRHSIYVQCDDNFTLYAGNDAVVVSITSDNRNRVYTWDDLGDMISRIDRIVHSFTLPNSNVVIETWNEDRPEETQ